LRFIPHGKKVRKHLRSEDGNFISLRQLTGGAKGVGPPQLKRANKETWLARCRDTATANEHL